MSAPLPPSVYFSPSVATFLRVCLRVEAACVSATAYAHAVPSSLRSTQKTFTRWSPDWVAASLAFEAAGMAFIFKRARAHTPPAALTRRFVCCLPRSQHTVKAYRIAKHAEKLVEANKLLANALCESNSFYNAGNALSAAGDAAAELNNLEAATAFYEEACQRYREGASEKMAALVLFKCGK